VRTACKVLSSVSMRLWKTTLEAISGVLFKISMTSCNLTISFARKHFVRRCVHTSTRLLPDIWTRHSIEALLVSARRSHDRNAGGNNSRKRLRILRWGRNISMYRSLGFWRANELRGRGVLETSRRDSEE
jgi:hypothetical protein